MPTHIVEQGEHLSSIAEKFGFLDFRTIWLLPENANLRALRKNPHVLMPGDSVFVPDVKTKTENRATGSTHRFKIKSDKLKLKVLLQNIDGDPIEETTVGVAIDGVPSREPLAAGMLTKDIPRSARAGNIETTDDQVPMAIGELDPVTEESGQLARLMNLGYYRRPLSPIDEDERKSAIEEFQCDEEMPVTGTCDAATQDKLQTVHGC